MGPFKSNDNEKKERNNLQYTINSVSWLAAPVTELALHS